VAVAAEQRTSPEEKETSRPHGLKNALPKMAGSGAGDDDDNWGLTAEQLDQVERDAIRQLAERKASSASASTAPASPLPSRAPAPASSPLGGNHPAARASLEARFGKVRVLPRSSRCSRGGCGTLGDSSVVQFVAHRHTRKLNSFSLL
jgi:SWI/SNF-related matrix-associated actin-dependent regulator of chromatin subfamily A-like protein 1